MQDAAKQPDLTVNDHTKIMELVIKFDPVTDIRRVESAPNILARVARSGIHSANEQLLLQQATIEVANFLASPEMFDQNLKDWPEARAAVAKIYTSSSDPAALKKVLMALESNASPTVKIGLQTGLAILDDGAQTIYNPEFWIVAQAVMPADVFAHQLGDALAVLGRQVASRAVADIAGAIVGAVKGAITGGQAGAAKGAVSGAIAGSVRGGPGSAS